MAKDGSKGVGRNKDGGGLKPGDILSTQDMISERMSGNNQQATDEVLKVSKDLHDEYGVGSEVGQFLIAKLAPRAANTLGYYDGTNIGVNEKYMDAAKMQSAMEECAKTGFHPSLGNKTGVQAVAAHEFGHAINDYVAKRMGRSLDSAADVIVNAARRLTPQHRGVVQMENKISRYATTSNAEAVAEAVCDVYCNGSKATAESKAIVRIVKAYLA